MKFLDWDVIYEECEICGEPHNTDQLLWHVAGEKLRLYGFVCRKHFTKDYKPADDDAKKLMDATDKIKEAFDMLSQVRG